MLKGLDKFAQNINFKKVKKLFISISFLLLIVVFTSTLYVFRDKIAFAVNYFAIDKQVDRQGISKKISDKLIKLAKSTTDIKDILLLDKNNNIIFSAKKSRMFKDNKLALTELKDKKRFFKDPKIHDTYFKVIKPENLLLTEDLYKNSREIKDEYTDDFFYDRDYNAKNIYFLNYFADRKNGMKIFVINDIKFAPYEEPFINFATVIFMLILGFYWMLTALWVYKDSSEKKLNSALWGLLILLTNLVGLIVYAIYKQNNQSCYKCGSLQNKLSTFCSFCGTRINESCEKCGTILAKSTNYCIHCGIKINNNTEEK